MSESPNEYLPDVEVPPPAPEVEYETEFDKDPDAPQAYDLKKKLDTDIVFKKKLTKMALDVKEMTPEPNKNKKVETKLVSQENIAGDKNLTEEDFQEHKQPAPKKKRQMTQKQLDALARGRATSLAKRQAKKKARKEVKEEEEEYVKVEEPKETNKVGKVEPKSSGATEQKISWEEPEPSPEPEYKLSRSKPVSRNEIEDIMMGAIGKYDAQRKAEKKLKKEKQAKEVRDKRLTQQINRVLDPSNPEYYNDCFNFS
jgi:hypothetical protein